jgi:hypothetical protein
MHTGIFASSHPIDVGISAGFDMSSQMRREEFRGKTYLDYPGYLAAGNGFVLK